MEGVLDLSDHISVESIGKIDQSEAGIYLGMDCSVILMVPTPEIRIN